MNETTEVKDNKELTDQKELVDRLNSFKVAAYDVRAEIGRLQAVENQLNQNIYAISQELSPETGK